MNKRLVWLAPIALTVLLSGCSVTVTTIGPLAPDSLVGHKLELINSERGGPLHASDQVFPVKGRVAYHFLADNRAVDFEFTNTQGGVVDSETVSYSNSRNIGRVEITFPRSARVDFIVSCRLTFKEPLSGTHRCEFVDKERGTQELNTISSGWGEGTFDLEKP